MGYINPDDTVALDSLMRFVTPTVSGIPYELGIDLLRQAFTQFAMDSEMLSVKLDILPQKDVSDYEITSPTGYSIYKIRQAGFTGREVQLPQVNYWYVSYGVQFAVVGNQYIVFKQTPTSDSDDPFSVIATVIPDETLAAIPREVSIPFGQAIAKGALAEALTYKGKPWYDPSLASKMQREFAAGVLKAKNLTIVNRGAREAKMRGRKWV